MDFQIFGETLKIKSKKATIAFDPKQSIQKFDADCVILQDNDSDISRINNYRIVIDGPGEYEISGLKISGIKSEGGTIYVLSSENINTIVTKASYLEKFSSDKIGEYQIVIINADSEINESKITAMEPRLIILYGIRATEGAKILGKENPQILPKISISEEKLPEEIEIMLLA